MSHSPLLLPSSPLSASVTTAASDSDAASTAGSEAPAPPLRRNEHLAVLIARDLWKPDSATQRCDTFDCRTRFSLFERRHHCRKCGGVFCQACSARETTLLDASALDLTTLPRGLPIAAFSSSVAPVVSARVCDGCHDAIHGLQPKPKLFMPPSSSASGSSKPVRIAPPSASSSLCSSLATPPEGSSLPVLGRQQPRRTRTTSTASRASGAGAPSPRVRSSLLPAPRPLTLAEVAPEYANLSLGELDAYPLRFSSAICKATGGGRWTPKTPPMDYTVGKPGSKDFLLVRYDGDDEEDAERRRNASPIIVSGEFKYRFPPPANARPSPPRFSVATF